MPIKDRVRSTLKNRKGLIGGGSLLITLLLSFSALLPLKLHSMIENGMDRLGNIGSYAIEKRMEYIVTRWIATRMTQVAHGGNSSTIVFCKEGGILCSLGSTKYNEWFEKKLDAKFEADGVKVRTTINANGRLHPGGKAASFEMKITSPDPDTVMKGMTKELSHKDMRRHIRTITKKVHGKNYFLRFLSKRMLYMKYGVKRFNILPEKWTGNYQKWKANIKKKTIANISRVIGSKIPTYMSCLTSRSIDDCMEAIKKALEHIDAADAKLDEDIARAEANADEDAKGRYQEKKDALKENRKSLESIGKNLDSPDSTLGKIISKQIVKKIATGVAIVGVIDLVAGVVGAVDNGMLELVGKEIVSQTYISFAFSEDIGPMLVNDQMKAGDLTDMRYLELATSLFDGAEKSPLYQHIQSGNSPLASILYSQKVSASGGIQTRCETPDGEQIITLKPGELVCPERKIVQEYISFKDHPMWRAVAGIADLWNGSIGMVLDWMGESVSNVMSYLFSWLTEIPGVKQIANWSQEKIGDVLEWALRLFFRIPDVGIDVPGNKNYEALMGGLSATTNASLEAGQPDKDATDKTVNGIGGAYLNDSQLAKISEEIQREKLEEFNSLPVLAKIFDPYNSRSIAGQLISVIPTGKASAISAFLGTPRIFGSILAPRVKAINSDIATLKAFGIPWHGYADSSVFSVNPNKYTEESCKTSAGDRENSYYRGEGEQVPVYHNTDPCALEKTIGGILAYQAGDTESPNYIKELAGDSSAASSDIPLSKDGESVVKAGEKYFEYRYLWSGGHDRDPESVQRIIDGVKNGSISKETPILDCSGFVRASLYEVYGIDIGSGGTKQADTYPGQHLQEIPASEAKAGDIAWEWGHVEIVTSNNNGIIYAQGARGPNLEPRSIGGPSPAGWATKFYRIKT